MYESISDRNAMRRLSLFTFALCITLFAWPPRAGADNLSVLELSAGYRIDPNITYLRADGVDLKLDVYTRRSAEQALPTIIFFHGGGWMGGSKEGSANALLPYLAMGWNGVNVQYRLGGTALAPAAVEDTRCALKWVVANADKYGFDSKRIVLTGRSAGGHLALITGMLNNDTALDHRCPTRKASGYERAQVVVPDYRVAAIVNWAGITDVNDLIDGPRATSYAQAWLGGQPDRAEIARRVSPLSHVNADTPPVLTLHGDKDMVVPFAHAERLHKAMKQAGATHELHIIKGREHFVDFTPEDTALAYQRIGAFLKQHL